MKDFEYAEVVANAHAAFANHQYQTALELYTLALSERMDDVSVLSRAGILSIALKRYKDAFRYFSRAVELEPTRGDHHYNLGNAYFFTKAYAKSLDCYTRAEALGCSESVRRKLYLQKGLLCSMRNDIKSALVYLDKYETAHEKNIAAIDPRVYTERLRLHLQAGDYAAAEIAAAKLISVQPTEVENYMLSFAVLIAQKKYAEAEAILREAERYAVHDDKARCQLMLRQASLYTELAHVYADDPLEAESYTERALQIYAALLSDYRGLGPDYAVKLSRANLYMTTNRYSEAIADLRALLPETTAPAVTVDLAPMADLEAEAEAKKAEDDSLYDGALCTDDGGLGAMPDDDGLGAMPDDDGLGALPDDDAVYEAIEMPPKPVRAEKQAEEETAEALPDNEDTLPADVVERIRYLLLSCYVLAEQYDEVEAVAARLRESKISHYSYYARYCTAYAARRLAAADAERRYAETIAFFRSCMLRNPGDKYAVIFRARLYAEQGTYALAETMINLLGEEDRTALQRYLETCRAEQKGEGQ